MIQSIIFQFFLAALAMAAPLAGEDFHAESGNAIGYGTGGGIVGLIVLVLDVLVFSEFSIPYLPAACLSIPVNEAETAQHLPIDSGLLT
jgi:hypothetical protein